MLKSMTGFGRSEVRSSYGPIRIEIKTINHKYFELSSRLPGYIAEFEDLFRKRVAEEVRRGKVNLFAACPDPSLAAGKLILNERLAKEVYQNALRLRKILHSSESVSLRDVLRYPDVLIRESANGQRVLAKDLKKALQSALMSLKKSRSLEGAALEKDFKRRLGEIGVSLRGIEKRLPQVERQYRTNLEKKVKEFLKDGGVDRERVTQEVALFMKNSDISEEVTRMKSHSDGMKKALKESGEVGRKIDFIAQEMTRESNTMGAKSSDVVIANNVIHLKSAIEKIREQASNVE